MSFPRVLFGHFPTSVATYRVRVRALGDGKLHLKIHTEFIAFPSPACPRTPLNGLIGIPPIGRVATYSRVPARNVCKDS